MLVKSVVGDCCSIGDRIHVDVVVEVQEVEHAKRYLYLMPEASNIDSKSLAESSDIPYRKPRFDK